MRKIIALTFCLLISPLFAATFSPIQIVAAENFYGQLAKEIGGHEVSVHSILNNPNADPHLFSTSPETARKMAHANIIIYNGDHYDSWMHTLLSAENKTQPSPVIINVSELVSLSNPDNPHIWYHPQTFPKLAKYLTREFSEIKPKSKDYFEKNLQKFLHNYQHVYSLINQIKSKYSGTYAAATTPLYDYMAQALGFKVGAHHFQMITMNGSEPSPKLMIHFENTLQQKDLALLYNNSQVQNPNIQTLLTRAKSENKSVISISETLPAHLTITEWLVQGLQQTLDALNNRSKTSS